MGNDSMTSLSSNDDLVGDENIEKLGSVERICQRREYLVSNLSNELKWKRNFDVAKFSLYINVFFGKTEQEKKKKSPHKKKIPNEIFSLSPLKDTYDLKYMIEEDDDAGSLILVKDRKTEVYDYVAKFIKFNDENDKKQIEEKINLVNKFHEIKKNPYKNVLFKIIDSLTLEKEKYFVIIMQYTIGADLSMLMKFNDHLANKYEINKMSVLRYFIQIFKCFSFLKENGFLHGDIRPSNFVVYFPDFRDKRKMSVKIRNPAFLSPVVSKKGEDIHERYFYFSCEKLEKEGKSGDVFSDEIYSLFLLFFQIFFGISTSDFIEEIRVLIDEHVTKNEELIKKYGFDKKNEVEMLIILHKESIFFEKFIKKYAKNDSIITKLFSSILVETPSKAKLSYEKILGEKIVKTWDIVLNDLEVEKKEDVDVDAVFTAVKFIKEDEYKIFLKCLKILNEVILKDNTSLEENVELLFSRVILFTKYSKIFEVFFEIVLKMIMFDESLTELVTLLFRKYYLIEVLQRFFLELKNVKIYFLSLIMIKSNKSIREMFKLKLLPIFLKYTSIKDEILFYIVEELFSVVRDKETIEKIFSIHKGDDILFFKRIGYFKTNEVIMKEVHKRILNRLQVMNQLQVEETKTNLLMLLFLLGTAKEKKKRKKKKVNSKIVYSEHNIEMFKSSEGKDKNVKMKGNSFHVINPHPKLFSCIISTRPLVNFMINDWGKESVICFYELKIVNGGINDNVEIGITDKETSYVFNCVDGKVIKIEGNEEKEYSKFLSIKACTSDHIGVGITNQGNLLVTYNQRMVIPLVKLELKNEIDIHAFVRVKCNDYLKCRMLFAQDEISFAFREKKDDAVIPFNLESRMKLTDVLQSHRFRNEKDSVITNLCSKIIKFLRKDVKFIKDRTLIELYEHDESFKTINEIYPELKFNIEKLRRSNQDGEYTLF